ncbi:DUF2637 domain-containing protein [Brevibacterium casei]|uniref:DUF2637 domain-containing protein n=1 Tax=Brevibacterium casei TaxID=33889 RepID=UPI003F7DDE92
MFTQRLGWGWAVTTAATGTVIIGIGAFWLSFTALADLAARSGIPERQAWIWPLLVDGLIVVSTIAVVALDGRAGAWYPWTLLVGGALVSVVANALHAVVAADASVPAPLAAVVAAVPPLVLLASTHLTVVLTRKNPQPAEKPAPATPPVPEPVPEAPPVLEDALVGESVRTLTEPEPESSEPGGADETPGEGLRERAAELKAAGWLHKDIAEELRVHPSTVGRWLKPARVTTAHSDAMSEEKENNHDHQPA